VKSEERRVKSEGVAEGDIFKNISEGNTAIIHYSLFIIHYPLQKGEGLRGVVGAAPYRGTKGGKRKC